VNHVSLDFQGISEPAWLDRAETFIHRVLAVLSVDNWDLSIVFCNDPFIATLNQQYRQKEGPTDVLSFEQGEWYETGEGRRYLAGDVVLSTETLARNAIEFTVSQDEELRRLLVHGILHLAGRDHATNDAGEPMLAEQESILGSLAEETIF
jgi:probable rRNA maturation factor